jgi:hypothetical protein
MSKIFRRPMFRKGGNVGEGIMTGIVDRDNYEVGGSASERLMKVMQDYPVQTVDPIAQFLIQGGLRGLSQTGGGGTLGNLAKAFEEPTEKLFTNLGAQDKAKRDLALAGEQLDIEQDYAKDIAKIKATTESGLQKDYSDQRAYETAMEARIDSKNSLKSFDKPNLFQKYPEQTAEYDYLIKRNLRNQASTNTKAAEIYQNSRYLPYDTKRETFVYDDLMPGIYYYNPEQKVFVTRVPDTETEEGGLFKVNPYNFTMQKLPTLIIHKVIIWHMILLKNNLKNL